MIGNFWLGRPTVCVDSDRIVPYLSGRPAYGRMTGVCISGILHVLTCPGV